MSSKSVQRDHNDYIKKAATRTLHALVEGLPVEVSERLFFRLVTLEKNDATSIDLFSEIIKYTHEYTRENFDVVDFNRTLSTQETIHASGLSRSSIQGLLKHNAIIGYRHKGDRSNRFPAWQFKGGRPIGGIQEVLAAIGLSGAEAEKALVRPISWQGGVSIAAMLRDNDIEAAIATATREAHYRSIVTSDTSAVDALFNSDVEFHHASGHTETL